MSRGGKCFPHHSVTILFFFPQSDMFKHVYVFFHISLQTPQRNCIFFYKGTNSAIYECSPFDEIKKELSSWGHKWTTSKYNPIQTQICWVGVLKYFFSFDTADTSLWFYYFEPCALQCPSILDVYRKDFAFPLIWSCLFLFSHYSFAMQTLFTCLYQ